jgi:hypothetical protein
MKKFLLSLSVLSAATLVPTSPSSAAVASCTRPQAGLVRGDRACVRINGRWSWRQLASEASGVLATVESGVTPPTAAAVQAPTTLPPEPTTAPAATPTTALTVLPDPCKLMEPGLPTYATVFKRELYLEAEKTEATLRQCMARASSGGWWARLAFSKDKSRSYYDDVEPARYLPNPDGSFVLKDGSYLRIFVLKKGVRVFFVSGDIQTNEQLAAAQVLFNSVVAQI